MPYITQAQARTMTQEERMDYLTRTVLGEAAGEGYVGMVVVGQVIANRSRDGRWPADPVAVAGQNHQFSTHSTVQGVGNQDRVRRDYPPTSREYRMARAAIEATVVNGTAPDITGGAVQYHTIQMGWPASWPTSIRRNGHIDIGNHRVYPTHPVPPADIPGAIAQLEYQGQLAANNVRVAALAPIRPAQLSTQLRLQRELNRVASQTANAPAIRQRARALAFEATINPFDVGRPARGGSPIINRPQPAMRESMQRQLRATGTPNMSARAFAFMHTQPAERTLVSTAALRLQAPPVAAAPWGVRESVAAAVAASDAANGRGQLVMTGNPNAPRSVVSWLYPTIEEGQGEGNQAGKGPRATPRPGQSIIERGQPIRLTPTSRAPAVTAAANRRAQANEQREQPRSPVRVVVRNGQAQVVPESATLRPDMISESLLRSNEASARPGAQSLAASIAARRTAQDVRTLREAEQNAVPIPRSTASPAGNRNAQRAEQRTLPPAPSRAVTVRPAATQTAQSLAAARRAADVRTLREAEQAAADRARVPSASGTTTRKNEARLPNGNAFISPAPTPMPRPTDRRSTPTQWLPPLAPSTAPIGTPIRPATIAAPVRPAVVAPAPQPKPRTVTRTVTERYLNPAWRETVPAGTAMNTGSRDSVAQRQAGQAAAANVQKWLTRTKTVTETLPPVRPPAAKPAPVAGIGAAPATRVVPVKRVTTVAPQPILTGRPVVGVQPVVNGRPVVVRPTLQQAATKQSRPPLEILVEGSRTEQPRPKSVVQQYRDQGMSPSEAYDAANRGNSSTTMGTSSSGRRYDTSTNSWSGSGERVGNSSGSSASR